MRYQQVDRSKFEQMAKRYNRVKTNYRSLDSFKVCMVSICSHLFDDTGLSGCAIKSCGSVAQWSECSHGMREVLGSSPGGAMCFFLPCDIW